MDTFCTQSVNEGLIYGMFHDFMSILQGQKPEVILSYKCHMNTHEIFNSNRIMGIFKVKNSLKTNSSANNKIVNEARIMYGMNYFTEH